MEAGEDLELVCHFCNTKYKIGVDELSALDA